MIPIKELFAVRRPDNHITLEIHLENIGKRYNRDWIFRHIDSLFTSGDYVAILGANGSGKSTLLQLLAGYVTPSEGHISWKTNHVYEKDNVYQLISLATPYMNVFDDFTLEENIRFHSRFKRIKNGKSISEIAHALELDPHYNKQLRFFSSGMKQRVKLGLAIMSDTPLLFLDEPSSHLDRKGIEWYQKIVSANISDRIVFIASNRQEQETFLCHKKIEL